VHDTNWSVTGAIQDTNWRQCRNQQSSSTNQSYQVTSQFGSWSCLRVGDLVVGNCPIRIGTVVWKLELGIAAAAQVEPRRVEEVVHRVAVEVALRGEPVRVG
jgi:hypothetical protein